MKIIFALVFVMFSSAAWSADEKPRRPADAIVIDALVLPPDKDLPIGKTRKDFENDTTVTTRRDGEDTVTEYRLKGQLYKMVVKPAKGAAYTLVDEKGDGKFVRSGEPVAKVAVPMWTLLTW